MLLIYLLRETAGSGRFSKAQLAMQLAPFTPHT